MIGQNVLMELVEGDKIQLYAYTSTGITDHKASHYTQFIGVLMRYVKSNYNHVISENLYTQWFFIQFNNLQFINSRPAIDTLAATMRRLGSTDFGDEEIGADDVR